MAVKSIMDTREDVGHSAHVSTLYLADHALRPILAKVDRLADTQHHDRQPSSARNAVVSRSFGPELAFPEEGIQWVSLLAAR